jgi:D-alanyl-D-alanine dipeptidase
MPIIPARGPVDPAMAIAPNAGAAPPSAQQDPDAAVVTEFGAALTLMLGHVAKPAAGANDIKAPRAGEPTEPQDGASDDPDTQAAADDPTLTSIAGQGAHAGPALMLAAGALVVTDTKTITHNLDLLNPEFRNRLERVIERMESEYGYKVEVTETYRSQSRQDALFAQGRTEPGHVVTWTRASNHTIGRAADLVIDGSYDSALPYERLMRIAREEGLRTLGARDPGHVELPSSSDAFARGSAEEALSSGVPTSSPAVPANPRAVIARPAPSVASLSSIVAPASELEHPALELSTLPGHAAPALDPAIRHDVADVAPNVAATAAAPVARVATVAPVAQVAVVAQVAQVATVGAQATPMVHAGPRGRTPDGATSRAIGHRMDEPDAAAEPLGAKAVATQGVAPSATRGEAGADDATRHNAKDAPNGDRSGRGKIDPGAVRDSVAQVLQQSRDELVRAVAGTDTSTRASSISAGDAANAPTGHSDMSERIARLLKVQDAANDRPLSQVMLRLERPDGGEDRLRVDLRGNTVSATLDVSDPAAADRLSANVKELQRSLERQGLQTDSLTVRTVPRSLESSTLSRAVSASVESDLQRSVGSTSTSSTNTSSRERGARHDEQRPSPDSQRQRSRREHKGDR